MWEMGGLEPTLAQVHHCVKYNRGTAPVEHAIEAVGLLLIAFLGIWRARPAPRRPRVRGGRLFDRRHFDLAVDLALRVADDRHEPVPQCEALVPGDRRATGGAEGLQGSQGRRRSAVAPIARRFFSQASRDSVVSTAIPNSMGVKPGTGQAMRLCLTRHAASIAIVLALCGIAPAQPAPSNLVQIPRVGARPVDSAWFN